MPKDGQKPPKRLSAPRKSSLKKQKTSRFSFLEQYQIDLPPLQNTLKSKTSFPKGALTMQLLNRFQSPKVNSTAMTIPKQTLKSPQKKSIKEEDEAQRRPLYLSNSLQFTTVDPFSTRLFHLNKRQLKEEADKKMHMAKSKKDEIISRQIEQLLTIEAPPRFKKASKKGFFSYVLDMDPEDIMKKRKHNVALSERKQPQSKNRYSPWHFEDENDDHNL